ncbi:serine/arginine repetitive matrix protein 1-like [Penaeus chinensis]|uniref:serine/arginine repetitive matrix protein 1-like n=1 Tax=Penaeus chinensis TaxID=139456 RepID=UPI001FB7CFF9|nr:serine/arginine repetitive matrix protein 1-like [Penaeus chinensis]
MSVVPVLVAAMSDSNKICIIVVCTILALLTVLSVLYCWYRRRPQRGASLRSCIVAATIDGGEELKLSAFLAELKASTSQAYRCPGGDRPPPQWPRQGPDPMREYFRQRPIARPTRVPPSPPQETRPRRRAKRRRRHKAPRRSAHPATRRKSLVGACAEAPPESGSGEGTAAEKENRADASARRADSRENDYAHGWGSRRRETRVFRKGSGRRRSLRRGRLVPLEAHPAAGGRTPRPANQRHSAGLHHPEDCEDVVPGPLGSPTSSFASQREILTPPPSPPLRPPGEKYPPCPLLSPSAPPPTPAISPREMVSLLEQRAAASFPVPWVVVSSVAPSERGVWPPLAPCQRNRRRLHSGMCLPRGSDLLTADDAEDNLATSPVIRRRSRSKGKEGQGRPFTPPTPDLNSHGFIV